MQKFCPAPKNHLKNRRIRSWKRYLHFHLNDAIFDLNLRSKRGMEIMTKFCCRKMVQTNSATGSVFVEAKATGTTSRTTSCATNKQTSWEFWFPLGWYWI